MVVLCTGIVPSTLWDGADPCEFCRNWSDTGKMIASNKLQASIRWLGELSTCFNWQAKKGSSTSDYVIHARWLHKKLQAKALSILHHQGSNHVGLTSSQGPVRE